MSHIGIITPPVSGHLHPFGALGRALIKRGHRVTLFQMSDIESKARAEKLDFCVLGASYHPLGSLPVSLTHLSRLKGLAALRFTVQAIKKTTDMICRDGPAAIQKAGVDLLLVDQTEPAGGSVAEHLGIPFITVCNALAIHRENGVPPPFTAWSYNPAGWARLRNALGYEAWNFFTRPVRDLLARYRHLWNLPPLNHPDDSFSTLAQISQQIREFDFPRQNLPACFHYVGPLRDESSTAISFPWDQINGKPLIYASLGTLQNRALSIFTCIAKACQDLAVQLVISHGGGLSNEEVSRLPGSPLVVPYAPQPAVMAKARLTITHGGLNTVLDSLSQGIPVVAIPLTYEQPAIAARLAWIGTGEVIPYAQLSASRLKRTIDKVMHSQLFYTHATQMADSIRMAGGVERAAAVIEEVLATGKTVLGKKGE